MNGNKLNFEKIGAKEQLEMIPIGRFYISKLLSDQHRKNMAETLALLKFFPLRVEYLARLDCFEMIGLSDSFDFAPRNRNVPFYEIRIRSNKENKVEFAEVVRKNE